MPKVFETETHTVYDISDQWADQNGEYTDIQIEPETFEKFKKAFPNASPEELAVKMADAIKEYLKAKEIENE